MMPDYIGDSLLARMLDAEMDIRAIDAQLAMRGLLKATNSRELRARRVHLERVVLHLELQFAQGAA